MPLVTSLDRDILRLAIPALGALIAEPLFLITDTALVGHLGETALAGLGIASVILQTALGLLIFLAYATTPAVARRLGAGDTPGAIRAGIDGLWLAIAVGALLVIVGVPAAEPLVAAFGSTDAVSQAATTYLAISLWGMPAMLLVLAATGLLRGLQDTRTPLVVASVGFGVNAGLNALFIYGFGWGIAGSAAGTVVAQWGMAAVYLVIAVRAARATGTSLRPGLAGVTGAATSGGWLLLRTASLRIAMLATVVVATGLGVTELATMQIALTIFATAAFALDALAIAGQAMIGHGLGASDVDRVRAITRRLIQLGIASGLAIAALIAVLSPVLGPLFTSDVAIRAVAPGRAARDGGRRAARRLRLRARRRADRSRGCEIPGAQRHPEPGRLPADARAAGVAEIPRASRRSCCSGWRSASATSAPAPHARAAGPHWALDRHRPRVARVAAHSPTPLRLLRRSHDSGRNGDRWENGSRAFGTSPAPWR